MQGVVLPGDRKLVIKDFDVPEPTIGQVLIQIKASSLCGSDLRAIYRPTDQGHGPEAYKGVIAGHEPCGVIHKLGEGVVNFKVGDRVVMYHIAGCGSCRHCRKGWMISCSDESRGAYGWQRNGGHSQFMIADERTLVRLPDYLTYLDGAMVACGVGTAYAAICRANVSGSDKVLITGMGPVGVGLALLCKAMGSRVFAVEAMKERIEFAKSVGVEDVVHPDDLDTLKKWTDGDGYEVTFDCSGNSSARHLCLEMARDWGRVVFIGEGGTVSFEPSPLLIHKQLTLHGSWVCSISQMEDLVELLVRWKLHPEVLVTHKFRLDQAKEAYELFDSGKTGKVAIVFED
ncbi:alcohol dehydrogenase [Acrasis kona]|uniref:Alcohol dehydrogenase n=1 Tax=Acrasis kona TaxID=1008807 RepID=A0AAW2ZKE7_9EUKA